MIKGKESKPIKLDELTPEQRKSLMQELEEQQKAENEKVKQERSAYKDEVSAMVDAVMPELQEASNYLSKVKKTVFAKFKEFVDKKSKLYNREDDQNTHTFSNKNGTASITMGFTIIDGWDDTVETGIGKVKDYLKSLVNKDNKDLLDTIDRLLSKDGKGNLKASRVLQLKQLAERQGNKEFLDAIDIIQAAYKPVRSKEFIRVELKKQDGSKYILPLSITDAELSSF